MFRTALRRTSVVVRVCTRAALRSWMARAAAYDDLHYDAVRYSYATGGLRPPGPPSAFFLSVNGTTRPGPPGGRGRHAATEGPRGT